jgi:uncharacterized protein YkwD
MPDLPSAPELQEWIGRLNALDLVLLVFFALSALSGIRQGLVRGALGLLGTVGAVVLAIQGYRPAAELLRQWAALPEWLLNVLAFIAVLVVGRLVIGLVPGLLQAVLFAAVILTPLHLVPLLRPIADAIDGSVIAREITGRVTALLPQLEALVGQVVDEGPVFRPQILSSETRVPIPAQRELSLDPDAETRMLELVNAERARAGLRPLVADERVRAVARDHSADMFRTGYFSHTSPSGDGPAERIRRGGIPFLAAGENLALAPTVDVAHSGLMASPGHRQNILTPEFSRIGIGVVSAGPHGRMFTQNFVG